MKSSSKSRSQRNLGFKVHPVAAGCAVLLMMGADMAVAQQAETQQVTVTGIRAAIESAISVKKNAGNIVESMNAEDIGKMPDATVAESISRLPGVTVQRDATGKAKGISVRGMSPDFNGTLLNGREMATTGDSRGVEFDQFPAELVTGLTINKTPNATLVGQGLSSTVDMSVIRPLDRRERVVAVNARNIRTGLDTGGAPGTGERQSFSYVDQFADRKIGVAIGVASTRERGAAASNGGGNGWGRWDQKLDLNGQQVLAPGGFGEDVIQNNYKREGAMAVFQFKPNKDFETTIDLFRSKGNFSTKKTGIEGAIACQPAINDSCTNFPYDPVTSIVTSAPYEVVTVDGKNYLKSATLAGVKANVRNHLEGGNDSLQAFGWNTKFKALDWSVAADLSRSKVKRESDRFETTAGLPGVSTAAQLGTLSYSGYVPGGPILEQTIKLNGINYADRSVVKLTDVMGWSGGAANAQAGYNAHPTVTDEIKAMRLSARKDMSYGLLTGLELGLNLTDRDKVRVAPEGVLRILPGTDPYAGATMPGSATTLLPTLGISVMSWDPRGSVGTVYQRVEKVDKDILNKDWSVKEKVTTGYVKGDLEGKLFGLDMSGNVGLQIVQTNQSSTGFNVNGASCSDATTCTNGTYVLSKASHSYVDFNPSLNLNFDIGREQALRVGIAKVLARPTMADMRSSLTYSVGNNGVSGEAGNPNLEPFRAKSFDVSYEKYFGTKGYVSAAAFYKRLDSYILRTDKVYDFSKYMTAAQLATTSPIGNLSSPSNGKGGSITGIELTANLPLNMLDKFWDGFGVQASFSMTESGVSMPASGFKTQDLDSSKNIPLPGLSRQVGSLRAYYEKFGWQVSLGARARSNFLGEISNFQDDRSLTYVKNDTVVDAQVGYEFQTGYLKGLSGVFQITNLTNAVFERYRDKPENSMGKNKYGKGYLAGIGYKF